MLFEFLHYFSLIVFSFVCAGIVIRFVMLLLAILWLGHEKKIIKHPVSTYPKVSLLIPAYNEENTIVESMTHAINQEYPDLEIIVVNDGSKDKTLQFMTEAFELFEDFDSRIKESIPTQPVLGVYKSTAVKNLIVIDKKNGGKADALNCAINMSTSDHILCIDADTILTRNVIKYLIKPFLLDDRVVATSGCVRIMNQSKKNSIFIDLQKIEFVNSISLFRTGWNFINANLIVSGALGLFKRDIVIEVGGYHNLAIGEDMELIVRIHRLLKEKKIKYKILQLALPSCFTKALPNMSDMSKQRKRWQKGLLSSLRLNMSLIGNIRYGWIGLVALPFYVLFELAGPFLEILGLVFYLALLYFSDVLITPLLIWFAGLIFAVMNSWLSITLDKVLLRGMPWSEYLRLIIASSTDPFFYHFFQLYCKIKGTIEYLSEVQVSAVWDTKR